MRHRVKKATLNRQNSHRKATLKALVQSLVLKNRIQTTLPKARLASSLADRLVTLAKRRDLNAQRLIFETLQGRDLTHRLVHVLAPLLQSRQGGYTRIVKLMPRKGDAAPMALLEWVEFPAAQEKQPLPEKKEEKKQVSATPEKRSLLKGLKRFFRQPA